MGAWKQEEPFTEFEVLVLLKNVHKVERGNETELMKDQLLQVDSEDAQPAVHNQRKTCSLKDVKASAKECKPLNNIWNKMEVQQKGLKVGLWIYGYDKPFLSSSCHNLFQGELDGSFCMSTEHHDDSLCFLCNNQNSG